MLFRQKRMDWEAESPDALDGEIGAKNRSVAIEAHFYFFPSSCMVTHFRPDKQVHMRQKFDGLLKKPQLGNLREIDLGMVLGESSYLSTIGSVMAGRCAAQNTRNATAGHWKG